MAEVFDALDIRVGIVGGGSAQDFLRTQQQIALATQDIREQNLQLNRELRQVNRDSTLGLQERIKRREELSKQLAENGNRLRQLRTFQREANNAFDSVDETTGAYKRLSAELRRLTTLIQDARAAGGPIPQDAVQRARQLDAQLKEIDASVGRNFRNIGNYRQGLTQLGDIVTGGLLTSGIQGVIATGAQAITNLVTSANETIREFETSLAELEAITGASEETLDFLGDSAISLSRKYGTSATDILKASQVIASAAPQLLDNAAGLAEVTRQAEILSQASGVALPEAGKNLATFLNQFQEAPEAAEEFTNILAVSQQLGTAAIPALSDSFKNVGSVLAAANVDFATGNALLQALAKGGLEGAEAGTQLRNIVLRLAETNRDDLNPSTQEFTDILDVLASEVTTVTEATEFFGKENAAAALTLIQQRDVARELIPVLGQEGLTGALEQAAIRTDTVSARVDIFRETWNSLVLELDNGSGIFSRAQKAVIDFGTSFLDAIRFVNEGQVSIGEAFAFYTSGGLIDGAVTRAREAEQAAEEAEAATRKRQAAVNDLNRDIILAQFKQGIAIEETARQLRLPLEEVDNIVQSYIDAQAELEKEGVKGAEKVAEAAKRVVSASSRANKDVVDQAARNAKELVDGSVGALRNEIKNLQADLNNQASPELYASVLRQIDEAQERLDKFIQAGKDLASGAGLQELNASLDTTVDLVFAASGIAPDEAPEFGDDFDPLAQETEGEQEILSDAQISEIVDRNEQLNNELERLAEEREEIFLDSGATIVETFAQLLEEGESFSDAFSKSILTAALDALERSAAIAIAEASLKAFAANPITGAIVAGVATAAIRAVVARAKQAVLSFGEGGEIPASLAGGEVSGDYHTAPSGGAQARIKGSGVPVLLEGREAIVNRRSMGISKSIIVEGTPRQVASAVNALNGYGKDFAPGATVSYSNTINQSKQIAQVPSRPLFVTTDGGAIQATGELMHTSAPSEDLALALRSAMDGAKFEVDVVELFSKLKSFEQSSQKRYWS